MVRYHLFGSSVDCVTTLEQACTPGRIRMSEAFARSLRPADPMWSLPADLLELSTEISLMPSRRTSLSLAQPPNFTSEGGAVVLGAGLSANAEALSPATIPRERRLTSRGLNFPPRRGSVDDAGGSPSASIVSLHGNATSIGGSTRIAEASLAATAMLKRCVAAASRALSPDFDFESAPALELKGLGVCPTFHFILQW